MTYTLKERCRVRRTKLNHRALPEAENMAVAGGLSLLEVAPELRTSSNIPLKEE